MLTLLGSPRRCCDSITRRETLKVGALSALGGFGLPQWLQAAETGQLRDGKAKSVIVLYLLGGAATQDMFDLKPDAPVEVRSQFQPIATSVPGIEICEHLPQTATWLHKAAIVRTVNHKAGCHNTLPSYTGYEVMLPDITGTKETYPPSMGSVCEYLRTADGGGSGVLPDYVYMPCHLGWGQNIRRPGPYGGFLGKRFDALTTACDPFKPHDAPDAVPGRPQTVLGMPQLADTRLPTEITLDRLQARRGLLDQLDDEVRRIDRSSQLSTFNRQQHKAFEILTSSEIKSAFAIDDEDPKTVDRYGRTLFGHSTLIARRLVERGVRFVNVTWDLFWDRVRIDYDAWDTHTNNFPILQHNKLPGLDQTYSALLADLDARGLLEESLVVVMSEMGRTPRINRNCGRDHWTDCYSVLLAGGGIRGGTVYGESDAQAAYVKDRPVSTSDICATIYTCLGIPPDTRVLDRSNRPVEIAHGGQPVQDIML